MQRFRLIPFPSGTIPPISINGTIKRVDNQLSIHYEVSGDIDQILLPAPSTFTRKHDLWKATCFEFFIAIKDQPRYWEFNLAPSNDWNVYAMDAYRQVNMREESVFTQLPFEFGKTSEKNSLEISVNLNPILPPEQTLQIGIATIIQTTTENETYWALIHPGQAADFHSRDSFVIES